MRIEFRLSPDGEYEVWCADGASQKELSYASLLQRMFGLAWMWDGKKEYWPLALDQFIGKQEWKRFIQDHVGEFDRFDCALLGFWEHCTACFGEEHTLTLFDFDPTYEIGAREAE